MEKIKSWLSYDWNNWKKIFNNFIGGYFNMDTDDIYDSLDEYMTVSNNENKLKVLNSIKEFLDYNEMTEEEKNKFIEEETLIYYEYYNLTPIKWIKYIEKRLEEEINK